MRTSHATQDQTATGMIRALSSLTDTQAAVVAAALPNLPGCWELDRHEDYDGHLSLLLTMAQGGDEMPAYMIDRDRAGLHLRAMSEDTLVHLGSFATVTELLQALRVAVAALADASATIHAA